MIMCNVTLWVESLKASYHPVRFCGHRHCGSGDMFLVCHVVSQNHVIIWSFDFKGIKQSR